MNIYVDEWKSRDASQNNTYRVIRGVPPVSTVREESLTIGCSYLEVEVIDQVLVTVR